MSARREKRLRKLEAKIASLGARVYALEKWKLDSEDPDAEDAHWEPAPPRRPIWHRLLDVITGRAEP